MKIDTEKKMMIAILFLLKHIPKQRKEIVCSELIAILS